jgi:hypothetical protein
VSFIFSHITTITTTELEKLETAIKQNTYFVLKPAEPKGTDFFVTMQVIHHQKVLDGTLN